MKKILITGGAGFVGSHLARRLLNDGHEVVILDNFFRGTRKNMLDIEGEFTLCPFDIRNLSDVISATKGVDTVFHLAFINGTQNFYLHPELVMDVGLNGLANVLIGCEINNVPELIYTSSSEVYQTPDKFPTPERVDCKIPSVHNPRYSYAATKIMNELTLVHAAPSCLERILIVRPHNVYGPGDNSGHVVSDLIHNLKYLAAIQNRTAPHTSKILEITGTGEETRTFDYIDDFIDGLITVWQKGAHRQIYNLGGTEETKISDLAHMIARLLGVRIVIKASAPSLGSTNRRWPDISKVKALGHMPKVSLEEGLKKTIDRYKEVRSG